MRLAKAVAAQVVAVDRVHLALVPAEGMSVLTVAPCVGVDGPASGPASADAEAAASKFSAVGVQGMAWYSLK